MNEKDEKNSLIDKWQRGAVPFVAEGDVEELEFCPFCGDFVKMIDGACGECGKKIPAQGVAKSVVRSTRKTTSQLARNCYNKGKKAFYDGKSGKKWFIKAIKLDPESYWGYFSYYYLGREDLQKGDLVKAEGNFRTSVSGVSDKAWPHYYLGKTLFQKEAFTEAEIEFKKSLEIDNALELARTYIDEIKLRKTKLEFPQKVINVENLTENIMLQNHALIEWFEINIREFVKIVLEEEYGEEKWWRRGVPANVRKHCASRKEESPEEEMDCSDLSFSQFYNYAEVIGKNKSVFSTFIDTKEWIHKLNELEPIRNGIMHCRGRHLSIERNLLLKKWCYELEEILEKITETTNK